MRQYLLVILNRYTLGAFSNSEKLLDLWESVKNLKACVVYKTLGVQYQERGKSQGKQQKFLLVTLSYKSFKVE